MKYRVRNWKEYNESLVKRGSLTVWFDKKVLQTWQERPLRGRPRYTDEVILCGLTLKAVYRLTFRAVEGFMQSIVELLKLPHQVPDYTLLCKRQKTVKVKLSGYRLTSNEAIHLVVDTTGIKVYGEGEWKVRQHGVMKKRLWRKLHLGINAQTQAIEAFELSELKVQDSEGFPRLLDQIKKPIIDVIGDGTYDRFSCYEASKARKIKLIAPPQCNAVTSEERRANKQKASVLAVGARDEAIIALRRLGRKEWKQQTGYHRRSLAETGIFRLKTLLGDRLSTRKLGHQTIEMAIRCQALNQLTALGMPHTVAV